MRISFLIFIVFVCLSAFSQETGKYPILTLHEQHFDFGRIFVDNGNVQHTFKFVNSGKKPLVINNVRSTCGCTSPSWTKTPVMPGDEGEVLVEFDPLENEGKFHKTVQIQSNAKNTNMFLTVSGNVIPAPQKEDLQFKVGQLSIRSKHLNLGFVFKGDTITKSMLMSNQTTENMEISFDDVPGYMQIKANPANLKPGEYGYIELSYFSGLVPDWDVVIDRIPVIINGKEDREARLPVTANLREDFSNYSEVELDSAPVARFASSVQRFTLESDTEVLQCKFKLTNVGQSPLIIRAVKPSCGCTAAKPDNDVLDPGESTFIEASFDPEGRKGYVRNSITVITNDPKDYKQYLYIEGDIKP